MTIVPKVLTEAAKAGLSRRETLRLLAANMALAVAGCSKPERVILPYVDVPERLVPGEILKFATTLSLGGFGRGVLVHSVDGRPIKIEGNPRHPASFGATDVFAEAAIFDLYAPDRSKTPQHAGYLASPGDFSDALRARLDHARESGAGIRLLTGPITSPTLLRLISRLLDVYPGSRWHCDDPLADAAVERGVRIAFGRDLRILPDLSRAGTILSLGSDFLGPGPAQIRHARDWWRAREPSRGAQAMARLYVVEAGLTSTGAKADHRLARHPGHMQEIATAVAHGLGADVARADLPETERRFVDACVDDLKHRHGLVLAGRGCSAVVHAFAHWINKTIDAPVQHVEPVAGAPTPEGLEMLAEDLHSGKAANVFVFDANPVYDAPPALRIAEGLKKADFSVHFGMSDDETARACQWHVPLSHELESWLDLRAVEGTASLIQPLVRPLYGTRSSGEWMASLLGQDGADGYDLVRETWADIWKTKIDDEAFDTRWRRALHDGVIENTTTTAVSAGAVVLPRLKTTVTSKATEEFTILLAPDDCLFDGSRAFNA